MEDAAHTSGHAVIPELLYGPVDLRVDLGEERAILFMADGTVRFRHFCRAVGAGTRPMIVSPALQIGNGHEVLDDRPEHLTIVASIACDAERGCLEHGFVTDGAWVSA